MNDYKVLVDKVLENCIESDGGCWSYQGYKNSKGYGYVHGLAKNHFKSELTHRVLFAHFIAEIPKGLVIDHLCRNRACCNPWHLEAVTQKVNILRGSGPAAVAVRNGTCQAGHPKEKYANCSTCDRARNLKRKYTPEQRESARLRANAWYYANKKANNKGESK